MLGLLFIHDTLLSIFVWASRLPLTYSLSCSADRDPDLSPQGIATVVGTACVWNNLVGIVALLVASVMLNW